MKNLILACSLLLAATGAQAQGTGSNPNSRPVQAYTTLGPAGAGMYRESTQPDNYSRTRTPEPSAREISGIDYHHGHRRLGART
jgi:hypothetical protein